MEILVLLKQWCIGLVIYFSILKTNAARILAFIPTASYSHQYTFHPVWRELSLRGHNVTILTTDPVDAPELTNLTQINASFAYKFMNIFHEELPNSNVIKGFSDIHKMFNNITNYELSMPEVQKLMKSREPVDIVITESIFPEFLAFGEIYKCPTILISSTVLQSIIHIAVGNPVHPVLNPEPVLPFHGLLSFKERFISTLYHILVNYVRVTYTFPEKEKVFSKFFMKPIPSIMDMVKKVDIVLVGANTVLYEIRAYGPATITFSGIHLKPPQVIPKVTSFSLSNNIQDVSRTLVNTQFTKNQN